MRISAGSCATKAAATAAMHAKAETLIPQMRSAVTGGKIIWP
jgi:hypothetical protein